MPESVGQGRFPTLRQVDEAAGGGIRYVYFDDDGNELLSGDTIFVPIGGFGTAFGTYFGDD